MDSMIGAHQITDVAALERLYGAPAGASVEKEINYIHPHYRAMIAASPFVVLATAGPEGLDTSPRGDAAGFVTVENEKTLLIPDRRGNNRVDTVFFQCSRAIWRSKLWDPAQHIERSSLPSLGTMIEDISQARINGATYDSGLYERLKAALY